MKIALGADHAGFALKEHLKTFLTASGYDVVDKGAFSLNPSDDYPDFIFPVAHAVANGDAERGIIIGMSGQGEAMAANRVQGVRAVVFYGGAAEVLTLSREHNEANILSLGAHFLNEQEADEAVLFWLQTEFSGDDRHMRRIRKIDATK